MHDDDFDPSGAHVDLTAVHRDDLFLDELSEGYSLPDPDRDEQLLSALMNAWREEVLAAPVPVTPTLADVEHAIAADAERRRRANTSRRLRIIAGAAAITAVAAAGLLVLSENSQPGDPLWNVKKVVFAEQAQQTQATVNVQSSLEQAETALAAGDTARAAVLVAQARMELDPVHDPATRDRMSQWIRRLQDETLGKLVPSSTQPSKSTTSSASSSATPGDGAVDSDSQVPVTDTATPSVPSSGDPSSLPPEVSGSPSRPSVTVPSSTPPARPAPGSDTVEPTVDPAATSVPDAAKPTQQMRQFPTFTFRIG